VPRPLAVAAGVLILVPGFLLGWAAIGIPAGLGLSAAAIVMSVASLRGAALCLSTSLRLLFNRHRQDGGLVSPLFLRSAAVLFGGMPVIALATGSWRYSHLPASFLVAQGFSYFGIAGVLLKLAATRAKRTGRSVLRGGAG
jgi:hypothetical protein